jgi:N-glycosylase/DNA lyase
VLMRLALRSGLVDQGDVEEVREATRDAFKQVAEEAGISPPVLDDLLWEKGREDADLIGNEAGDLTEPPRREGIVFY